MMVLYIPPEDLCKVLTQHGIAWPVLDFDPIIMSVDIQADYRFDIERPTPPGPQRWTESCECDDCCECCGYCDHPDIERSRTDKQQTKLERAYDRADKRWRKKHKPIGYAITGHFEGEFCGRAGTWDQQKKRWEWTEFWGKT